MKSLRRGLARGLGRIPGSVLGAALVLLAVQLLPLEIATADGARYLAPTAVDLTELLPPPPATGSAAAQEDLDAVLRAQTARTPESVAAAKADALVSVSRFADVLGPGFASYRLPKTTELFTAVGRDAAAIARQAKDYWQRPRPYRFSEQVTSILSVVTGGSYPSGHALYGCMTAVLLGVMVPEQRTALLARGTDYGENRVVGGVHYPTDVQAGCTAGKIVAAILLQAPDFQDDFVAAQDETRRALGLPAAPPKAN